jgi:hypothetical protein
MIERERVSRLSFSEPANWAGMVRRKHILRINGFHNSFLEEERK